MVHHSYDVPDGYFQGVFTRFSPHSEVSLWSWYLNVSYYAPWYWGNGFYCEDDGFDYYLSHASVWCEQNVYSHVNLYIYTSDYRTIYLADKYYGRRGFSVEFPQGYAPVGHADDFFQLIFSAYAAVVCNMHFNLNGYRMPSR